MRIHIKLKKLVIAVLAALVAAAGTAVVLSGINSGEKEEVLGENQSLIYAYVTSIEGNEVTYREVEESTAKAAVTAAQGRDGQASDESEMSTEMRPERGEPSAGTSVEGTDDASMEQPPAGTPAGEEGTVQSSDGGFAPGEEGTEVPQEGGFDRNEEDTGSTVTTYIPVGVTVHTASDNETTFSRLEAGDLLKILVENDDDAKQVIVEIWMLL